MKHIIIGCTLFSLSILCLGAQSNADSLRKTWENSALSNDERFAAVNQFYTINTYKYPVVSKRVAIEHLLLARKQHNLSQIIKAFNELAIVASIQGKSDSSLFYIEEAIAVAKQLNDSTQIGILYMNHGNALCTYGKIREGVGRYFESLYIFEKLNVKLIHQADINSNLGLVYYDLGLFELSRSYLEKAMRLYEKTNASKSKGSNLLNLAQTYFELGELNDAKPMLDHAIRLLEKDSNVVTLSRAYLLAASIYIKEKKTESASYFIEKALRMRKEIGNLSTYLEALSEKLRIALLNDTRFPKADQNVMMNLMDSASDFRVKEKASHLLFRLFKRDGNEKAAFEILEKHVVYADSLEKERDKFMIIREELQRDFNNKFLHREVELEKAKLANDLKHLRNIFLIIIGAIFAILIIVIAVRNRLKANEKEKLALLHEIEILKEARLDKQNAALRSFELERANLEKYLAKKINDTDWNVLCVLLENPVVSNKELAERVFLSTDGVGSSLRRMYAMFDVPESKYMKIGLLLKAVKISNTL